MATYKDKILTDFANWITTYINQGLDDLKSETTWEDRRELLNMYEEDEATLYGILELIRSDQIAEAYDSWRSLDTALRGSIPAEVIDYLGNYMR